MNKVIEDIDFVNKKRENLKDNKENSEEIDTSKIYVKIVEAEPYHIGLEDGFNFHDRLESKNYNTENLVSFTYRETEKYPQFFSEDELNTVIHPYVETKQGYQYIRKGDYIITDITGEKTRLDKDTFESTYIKYEKFKK